MPQITIPFNGPSYSGRSTNINAQECVNLIHSVDRSGGKSVLSLMNRPCLVDFAEVGAQPIRGQIVVNGILYTVSGDKFFRVLNNGTSSLIGTLDTSAGVVGIAYNGLEICIVDSVSGYAYTPESDPIDFAKITSGFAGGDDVTFIDSFLVVTNPGTGVAQSSGIRNAWTWSALDKATAEGDPDNLVAPIAIYDDLWLLGESTAEIWYYAGLPYGFPFLRRRRENMGLAARWGKSIADNTLYWMAQNAQGIFGIVRATGGSPQKVSTEAIDYHINTYGQTVSDCISFSFTLEGHTFVGFTFLSGNKTWVYSVNSGMFSEWRSHGIGRFRAAFPVMLNGRHIFGDITTGNLYEMQMGVYDDAGDMVEKIRTTQHIHRDGKTITYNSLWIDFESGVGLNTGQGEDPQAMLSYSDDGGHTWSNEHWRSIGKMGEYKHRAKWNRLGSSVDRIFKVVVSDPVKTVIIGAYADIEVSE